MVFLDAGQHHPPSNASTEGAVRATMALISAEPESDEVWLLLA